MNEIKCPHCGEVFQVDERGFADIVRQVRTQEFDKEIVQREGMLKQQNEQAVALAVSKVKSEAQNAQATSEARIAELEAKLAAALEQSEQAAKASEKEMQQVQQAERRVEGEYHYTDPALIPEDTQCILVLGGDGTLLQAARDVVHREIPMLGINLGTLGFLAEIDKTSIYTALDKLFADDYEIEERMMLTGTVWRGDKITGQDVALNDIVISRVGPPLRVIGFNNYVNDGYLNSYNADGIIIATPTGSTGYSLSCGGPIISPNAAMTVMTPIAPHTLNTRSIIFPEDDVITVELGEGRRQIQENGLASFDGDVEVPMSTGDRIVIKKASVSVKILKLNHLSFVEVLRQKMSNN